MIVVRENVEKYNLFRQAWAREVKTYEEALELIADMEAEDKAYGDYRPDFYEIVVMD